MLDLQNIDPVLAFNLMKELKQLFAVILTIGELEAMLDLQNIDPVLAFNLMKELKQLFAVIIEEVIDTFTSGDLEDIFTSFDITLGASIPIPRREIEFFEFSYSQTLGGILEIRFTASGDGYFELSIPVSVSLLTMKTQAGLQPRVGASVNGGLSIGRFIYGELELRAQILYAEFPTVAELSFAKFPLDVGIRMDMKLIPIELYLYAKLTVDTFLFGKKTLLSVRLWQYSAPAEEENVFDIHTKDPDKSPPQFVEATTSGSRKRSTGGISVPGSTRKCKVEQVPGFDYTEPAFQLEIAASDDKSQVTFTYSVGTVPGGRDVVDEEEFAGSPSIIARKLKGGVPLYFTVTAHNSAGGTATVTCVLPTYDLTVPTGRIEPAFSTTSHPSILTASAVVYDDSEIISQQEGVGFGGGIWGDQIVPWTDVDKVMTNPGSGGSALDQFTTARTGRLATTPLTTSPQHTAEGCAQACLDVSAQKCLSFNFDYPESICEILTVIEGHDIFLHKAGFYQHYERLGIGHAIEFKHNSVYLVHNNLYYYNLQLLNYIGYKNIITSVPILADFTPPVPGPLANVKSEDFRHEACTAYTHPKWHQHCVSETPLPNSRVIIDGPGSMAVFNGDKDLVDMLYTRSNTFIAGTSVFICL
ncbi:uncharacterized protein [Amphiura filiformis]|uniref:uncharacterized protein n=1 Tax=Amphiura filiformis TaxID=82378 RepID=UPI003B21B74B